MRDVDADDDELCIPKSRAAVKLDLCKHLPPRLSDASRSEDDAQTDQGRRDGSNGTSLVHGSTAMLACPTWVYRMML